MTRQRGPVHNQPGQTPRSELRRRARVLWEHEGEPYSRVAGIGSASERRIMQWAHTLGFRKSKRGRYEKGPCVRCLGVRPRDRIGERYRCLRCRKIQPPKVGPKDRAGVGVDMAEERRLRADRIEERKAGIRPPLPEPCVFHGVATRPNQRAAGRR